MVSVTFEPLPSADLRFLIAPPTSTSVLIVGAGPTGLLASYILAKLRVPSVIVERHALRLGQPKAHAINPRSLEILRHVGLDTAELRRKGTSAEDGGWVRFVSTLQGTSIGDLPYERQDEAVKEVTPEPLFNLSQPELEESIQEAALKTGLVSIHRRWEWKDYEIDQGGDPISEVTNRDSGNTLKVKAKFVIGADGTDSAVRKKLANVKWEGLPGHSADRVFFNSIHAKGDLRTKMTEMNRKGQLYFMLHPKVKGGIIIYDLSSSWVFARETDPMEEPISTFTEEKCRQLIDPCVGPGIKYEIASVNSWFTDPRICSPYSDATLRVFLAGDSAHSFPPSGGLGSNTGIGDVHNLCWKLKSVIDGKVVNPERFLSTYSFERIPVARANALQSFVNASRWWPFMKSAVELMSHISPDDDAAIEAEFQSPRVKAALQERIEYNRPHFDSLGLQLGYVYGEGDGMELKDDCGLFIPSAKEGARLPHVRLGNGLSILDFVSDSEFTLLLSQNYKLGEVGFDIGGIKITTHIVDVDKLEATAAWKCLVGISETVGLLVRPDQHVLGHVSSLEDFFNLLSRYL